MKILVIGTYKSEFDYFTIVIDKVEKNIFALKNFTCQSAMIEKLAELFKLNRIETAARFSLADSGTELNVNLIPKKYKKFTILK